MMPLVMMIMIIPWRVGFTFSQRMRICFFDLFITLFSFLYLYVMKIEWSPWTEVLKVMALKKKKALAQP